MSPLSFVVIGSGKVATHLSQALSHAGVVCAGVYSRTERHATALAERLDAPVLRTLSDVWSTQSTLLLIAIGDDALASLTTEIPETYQGVVIHTSGSTPMGVLGHTLHHGVLYPLQTFSHERRVEVSEIPFFIEGSSEAVLDTLRSLLEKIGVQTIHKCDSEQRKHIHLAAVFVCNFVNHMYVLGSDVLARRGLDPSTLHPLMRETLEKSLEHPPADVQTGPAVRNDRLTISRHLDLLEAQPSVARLYEEISHSIYERAQQHDKQEEAIQ